jgi:hypothetical protein
VTAQVTLPDTSCASAVGVGPDDIPHAYYTGNGIVTFTNDACPDHYSGELGFGISGVWFFSREGPSANGGDGVVNCYGSTDPTAGPTTGHHGAHTTINVRDDVVGTSVAFTVTSDYNRSEDNPFLPASNNAGDFDCGDSLVEPCTTPEELNTAPGCNPLDKSERVGTGVGSWSVSAGTLADFAGADGAIVIFIETVAGGTSGAAWTSGGAPPPDPALPLCASGPNHLGATGTVAGPAGTKLSCVAKCFDHVVVEARWQSGDGQIRTTFTSIAPCTGGPYSTTADSTTPYNSNGFTIYPTGSVGYFTCTIEIVGGTGITVGSGGCIDP